MDWLNGKSVTIVTTAAAQFASRVGRIAGTIQANAAGMFSASFVVLVVFGDTGEMEFFDYHLVRLTKGQ